VLRLASRPLSAILLAVDVAAVATGADQHLRAAAGAQKKPPSCIPLLGLVTQTWTKRATGGILPRHTCSARCGARRRYELRKVGIGAAPVLNEDRGFSAPSPALGVATSPDASEIGRTSRRSARSAEQQETDPQVKVRSLQWPPPKLFPPTVNARERRIPPAIHKLWRRCALRPVRLFFRMSLLPVLAARSSRSGGYEALIPTPTTQPGRYQRSRDARGDGRAISSATGLRSLKARALPSTPSAQLWRRSETWPSSRSKRTTLVNIADSDSLPDGHGK
jgi:hypothetical protein